MSIDLLFNFRLFVPFIVNRDLGESSMGALLSESQCLGVLHAFCSLWQFVKMAEIVHVEIIV
jgi:hypothetical protein